MLPSLSELTHTKRPGDPLLVPRWLPQGATETMLFAAMREVVRVTLKDAATKLGGDAARVHELVRDPANWHKQSAGEEAFGYVHGERMRREDMRSILGATTRRLT